MEAIDRQKFMEIERADVSEDGEVRLVVSSYESPDSVGDIFEKGSLEPFPDDGAVDLLKNHKKDDMFGVWKDFSLEGDKIYATAQIFKETSLGSDMYALAKRGRLKGASVGVRLEDYTFANDRGFMSLNIKKATLREISLLTVPPANPDASGDTLEVVKEETGVGQLDELILKSLGPEEVPASDVLDAIIAKALVTTE